VNERIYLEQLFSNPLMIKKCRIIFWSPFSPIF
jgi:hypothetical protein